MPVRHHRNSKSEDELVANWRKSIRLGLDLSSSTQLMMQVQLQDAFKADTDNTMDRLKQELQKDGIRTRQRPHAERSDERSEDADKIEIDVKGIPSEQERRFSQHRERPVSSDWVPTALNSTDYKLTMKPTEALKLKQDTMSQTMATIEQQD